MGEQLYKIEIFQPPLHKEQDTPEFRVHNPVHSWYKWTGAWSQNACYSNRTINEQDADLVTKENAIHICKNHALHTQCHPPIIVTTTY